MDKGDLKVKRKKGTKDYVTFDPRISADRKTFVLHLESTARASWFEFLNAIYCYSKEEMNKIMEAQGFEH